MKTRPIIAAVVTFALGATTVAALDDGGRDRLRPVTELQYVEALPGESYYSIWRDLELSCTHTELWQFNRRAPLDPGSKVEIPPRCLVGSLTTTTTIPPTTTTTTAAPATTTTVPQPARDVLVGAAIDRQSGQSWVQATAAFEQATGGPVEIARRFTSGFPTGRFDQVGSFAADIGLRHRWISVKGEPTHADWVRFLRTSPEDGYSTWVTINHEPENDGGTMTPERFKGKLRVMSDAIVEVGRPDIRAGFVLMSWAERDGIASTSSALWFPDADIITRFTLGIDPYDPQARTMPAQLVTPTIALWKQAGGQTWMVTETGTKRTGQDGVAWINAFGDLCFADVTCGGIMYFHSAVGDNGPWWLTDPAMLSAWGSLARRAA